MKNLIFYILCLVICGYAEDANILPSNDMNSYLSTKEVFVQVKNAQIFCRVFGKGEPVIVIHGGPGLSQDYLLPYMERLAQTNFVIFYDQRSCGNSTGEINAGTICLNTFVDDLESIRKFFGYKKITIVGHSWGGLLAMQYAIVHPEAIVKLILLNACPPSSEEYSTFQHEVNKRLIPYQDKLKAIQESSKFIEDDPDTFAKYFRMVLERYCYNPEKMHLINLHMSQRAIVNGHQVSEIFNQNLLLKPFNLYKELKNINIPTLIIHGDFDPVPCSVAQHIHESISGSQYILLKNCGHFPFVEVPDEFFKNLKDFINQK